MTQLLRRLLPSLGLLYLSASPSACALRQTGRLYEMKTGQSSTISVEDAQYSSGKLHGALPGGARCDGTFSLVTTENARELSAPDILLNDNADASIAVLRCSTGAILHCALTGRASAGFSYGACRDQQGFEYAVVF